MSNFQVNLIDLPLSEHKSKKRIECAVQTLGEGVMRNLVGFALFLLGADRLNMPHGTFLSLLTKIGRSGLPALEDRRQKESEFLAHKKPQIGDATVTFDRDELIVTIGGNDDMIIKIPAKNSLQIRVFLLTLQSNGILKSSTVASILKCTTIHCCRLSHQLMTEDAESLIDKRVGQKDVATNDS
jgi:hypothetical protein